MLCPTPLLLSFRCASPPPPSSQLQICVLIGGVPNYDFQIFKLILVSLAYISLTKSDFLVLKSILTLHIALENFNFQPFFEIFRLIQQKFPFPVYSRGVKTKEKCSNTAGIPLILCYYIFHYGKYQKFGNLGYKPPPYEASEDLGENEKIGKIWHFL